MRTLPKVTTLREAVNEVFKSNMADNYPPNRFRNMTANTTDNDLVRVCTNLVRKDKALSDLFNAFLEHPNLLTIEDFIAVYGEQWGFEPDIIEKASGRVSMFNEIVKHQRYIIA